MAQIRAIDKASVARICSGQVITDLATAVKELVENSMDAGAKHVEVKLKEYGLDLVEVSDSGAGIPARDYEGLALKYHTSKLTDFSDLRSISSFGFRGEALSSLCELAGTFTVTTRTTEQTVGTKLTYDRAGKLTSQETAPRPVGTTVSICNLFSTLPVRQGEFRRNIKKQYNRLLRVLQGYALISVGVRLTVTNIVGKKPPSRLIATQSNARLQNNVANIFGAKTLAGLQSLTVDVPSEDGDTAAVHTEVHSTVDSADTVTGANDLAAAQTDETVATASSNSSSSCSVDPTDSIAVAAAAAAAAAAAIKAASAGAKSQRRITGLVSKAGEGVGRSDNDRQFTFLNGRPVDLKSVTKVLNEVWRQYEMKHKPAAIINIELPAGAFDINVTPDKREVFITGEAALLEALKQALHTLWAPSRCTFLVNQSQKQQQQSSLKGFLGHSDSITAGVACATGTIAGGTGTAESSAAAAATSHKQQEPHDTDAAEQCDASSRTLPNERTPPQELLADKLAETADAAAAAAGSAASTAASSSSGSSSSRADGSTGHGWKRQLGSALEEEIDEPPVAYLGTIDDSTGSSGDRRSASTQPAKKQKLINSFARTGAADGSSAGSKQLQRKSQPAAALQDSDSMDVDAVRGSSKQRRRARPAEDTDSEDDNVPLTQLKVAASQQQQQQQSSQRPSQQQRSAKSSSSRRSTQSTAGVVDLSVPAAPKQWAFSPVAALRSAAAAAEARAARRAALFAGRDAAGALSLKSAIGEAGGADNSSDTAAAAAALSRVLQREDLAALRVVGQFNLGFIVALLRGDLFILDQHACDEKRNFERLQRETVVHQQPLVRALPLETTAAEEAVICDHLEVFRRNGFGISIDEDAPTGLRLKLTAVPFSKGVQFGAGDVHELASIVSEANGRLDDVRLPKMRAMFAMRACRSSIMVGDALDTAQMQRLLKGLAAVEQPWNCPHGRPTMRHLADVSASLRSSAEDAAAAAEAASL